MVIACAAFCQTQAPKVLKAFKPPDLRIVDPLIAKDEGCAKDLAKVPNMVGLEQRKFLADLFTYGCVRLSVCNGMHSVTWISSRTFGEGGKAVGVSHAKLWPKACDGFMDGWVLSGEVFDASRESGPKNRLISSETISKVLAAQEAQKK
jgi:hypothetical protein